MTATAHTHTRRRRHGATYTLLVCSLLFASSTFLLPTVSAQSAAAETAVPGAATRDPAELIVPSGHATTNDKLDELTNQLQEKAGMYIRTYTDTHTHTHRIIQTYVEDQSINLSICTTHRE